MDPDELVISVFKTVWGKKENAGNKLFLLFYNAKLHFKGIEWNCIIEPYVIFCLQMPLI